MIASAIAITSEAGTVPDHVNRCNYATLALRAPQQYGDVMAQGVASQGVDNTATDAAINGAVSSIWNSFSGVI